MRKVLVGSTIAMMLVTNLLAEEKKEENLPSQTTQEIVTQELDGKKLFKVCGDCHGEKAEKEALGKSQIIAGWDKERIINSINGYKNGNYGGIMKNIMRNHVANKTNAEIEALATYISTINN